VELDLPAALLVKEKFVPIPETISAAESAKPTPNRTINK
jgi:hypothetical protein